VFSEKRRK